MIRRAWKSGCDWGGRNNISIVDVRQRVKTYDLVAPFDTPCNNSLSSNDDNVVGKRGRNLKQYQGRIVVENCNSVTKMTEYQIWNLVVYLKVYVILITPEI